MDSSGDAPHFKDQQPLTASCKQTAAPGRALTHQSTGYTSTHGCLCMRGTNTCWFSKIEEFCLWFYHNPTADFPTSTELQHPRILRHGCYHLAALLNALSLFYTYHLWLPINDPLFSHRNRWVGDVSTIPPPCAISDLDLFCLTSIIIPMLNTVLITSAVL